MRVDELKAPVRVGWKTISSFRPEWDDTTITFALRAEGNDTVLSFAHRGFKQAKEGYAITTTGWVYYLVSLKPSQLETDLEAGKGTPHPNDSDYHVLHESV